MMTRGNQRDAAREKNARNQRGKGTPSSEQDGNKGLSLQERQARDAAKLREKQQVAEEKKTDEGGAAGGNNNASGGAGATASAS